MLTTGLINQVHEADFQVGEEQAKEKSRHDEQNQILLIFERTDKSNDAHDGIPHSGDDYRHKGVYTGGWAIFDDVLEEFHDSGKLEVSNEK